MRTLVVILFCIVIALPPIIAAYIGWRDRKRDSERIDPYLNPFGDVPGRGSLGEPDSNSGRVP